MSRPSASRFWPPYIVVVVVVVVFGGNAPNQLFATATAVAAAAATTTTTNLGHQQEASVFQRQVLREFLSHERTEDEHEQEKRQE